MFTDRAYSKRAVQFYAAHDAICAVDVIPHIGDLSTTIQIQD